MITGSQLLVSPWWPCPVSLARDTAQHRTTLPWPRFLPPPWGGGSVPRGDTKCLELSPAATLSLQPRPRGDVDITDPWGQPGGPQGHLPSIPARGHHPLRNTSTATSRLAAPGAGVWAVPGCWGAGIRGVPLSGCMEGPPSPGALSVLPPSPRPPSLSDHAQGGVASPSPLSARPRPRAPSYWPRRRFTFPSGSRESLAREGGWRRCRGRWGGRGWFAERGGGSTSARGSQREAPAAARPCPALPQVTGSVRARCATGPTRAVAVARVRRRGSHRGSRGEPPVGPSPPPPHNSPRVFVRQPLCPLPPLSLNDSPRRPIGSPPVPEWRAPRPMEALGGRREGVSPSLGGRGCWRQ